MKFDTLKMVFCFVSCCFVNCYLIDCTGLLDKKKMTILILLLIAAVFSSGNTIPFDHHVDGRCQNVTISECTVFNYSTIPKTPGQDVSSAFMDVRSLFSSGCSQHIQILVCFMLEPTCHDHHYNMNYGNGTMARMTITFKAFPCKSFCEGVKRECELYGAFWTSEMDCSELPNNGTCFIPPDYPITTTTAATATATATATTTTSVPPTTTETITIKPTSTAQATTAIMTPSTRPAVDTSTCPGRLISYQGVSYGGIEDCAAPCHYLYEEDRYSSQLVTFLFALWTILSVLAIGSFLSFLLTWKHYSHIEHPYHFLALSHALVFLAFVIRLGSGHDGMVCDGRYRSTNDTALVTEDVSNASCTAVFIIVYYSIVAISTWLVNLSFALCTRILSKWRYYLLAGYHLTGWGIPLIFVITASALKKASGDSLLGMCQVDNQYLVMLLVPVMVCAGLSFILLLFAVFQMLLCSQACVEVQHKHPGRFVRSLMFGVIVLIEIAIISVLYLIEYVTYEHWEKYYTECVAAERPNSDCPTRTFTRPSYVIPIIRYSLISLVGAVSIVWPLARRVTWKSWKDSACLLYQKVVMSFQFLRQCSWRNKSAVIVQMVRILVR